MNVNASNSLRGLALALGVLATGSLPAIAQDPGAPAPATQQAPPSGRHNPARMEQHQIERLTHHLNLTPDQVTQVKAIDDDQRSQMMSVRNDTATPREEKRARMVSMRQDSEARIRALLSEEQKPKFDQMIAHEKDRMQHGHRGPNGSPDAPPPAPPAG